MKSKFYSIALRVCFAFTFLVAATAYTNAQSCDTPPDCIANPDIIGPLGDLNSGGVQTVNDWYVAQGSPNIQTGGAGGTNRIGMWAFSTSGEGVYTCFDFQQNHTYQICLWVQNGTAETRGNLEIWAANGLTQNFSSSTTPTPSSSELIDDNYNYSASLVQVVVNYTPTADFSQLWIYPQNSVTAADYRIKVSRVNILEVPLGYGISAPCGGEFVLTGSSQSCATTSWFDPAGNPIGTGNVAFSNVDPSMAGNYTMTVTVGDCSRSLEIPVNIEDCNCDEFEASFKVSGYEQPIHFTETSSGPGTSVAWFWDFGDGQTSNDPNPVHNYARAGVYEVCLTVIRRVGNQTCCKKVCYEIEVGEPREEAEEGPQGPSTGESVTNSALGFKYKAMEMPHAIKFTESIPNNAFTEYSWDFGDGSTSGKEHPAHVFAKEGTYRVCLTTHHKVFDNNGNLVEESDKEYCNDVNVGPSIYDINQGEVFVMPNPSTNQAYVTVENIPNPQVILRSTTGTEVAKGKATNPNQFVVNLESLPTGVYIVEVKSEFGSKTVKLIKE